MLVTGGRGLALLDRLNVRRPAALALFLAGYAVVTAIAGTIYLRIPPSPDQSIFDYMAWLDLHGVPFYQGSFDMTWPGQLVFHELYLRLFGVHWWTARAGDFLLLQPAVLAIYLFLRLAGFPIAAIAAALIYPIVYVTSGGWMAGHRDLTGMHFLIGAAAFALLPRRGEAWRPIIAGLLVGYATMIRPTYLAFAPLLFLLGLPNWTGERPWRADFAKNALLFGLGVLIPAGLFSVYGLVTGTLDNWYLDSVRFVADAYQLTATRVRLFAPAAQLLTHALWWLTIVAVLGSGLWIISGRSRQALLLIAAMILTALISYFAQNKGFGYHLGGLIPLFVMLGCAGAEAGMRRPLRSAPLRSATAALAGGLLLAGTTLRIVHASTDPVELAQEGPDQPLPLADSMVLASIVKSESGPSDTFLQYGWEFRVSFLAERRSPTALINTIAARLIRPGQPVFGQWLAEFDRELTVSPPKFVLVDQTVAGPDGKIRAPDPADGEDLTDILERHLATGYSVRAQRKNYTLLERTSPT